MPPQQPRAEVARRITVAALWLASQPVDDATALDMATSYVGEVWR